MDGSIPSHSTPRPPVEGPPPLAPQRPGAHPTHDAILAFLFQPRQLGAIAAHVGRSKTATAQHLHAMQHTGAVVRVGWGLYDRAGHCAPLPYPISRAQPVRDAILAFLTEPRQVEAVAIHVNRSKSAAAQHLLAMRRRGLVVRASWETYARADTHPAPPKPIQRPQPIRDAILAFLADQPRHAEAVAAHIARSTATATGHLAAMRRRGLVVRVGWGTYARADRCPTPPHPDSITRGNPVRDRVLACLDQHQPRTLNEVAQLAGMSADRAQPHLCLLGHAGLATQVRRGAYQRTSPSLDAAQPGTTPPPPAGKRCPPGRDAGPGGCRD